jgi:hypothetical protein
MVGGVDELLTRVQDREHQLNEAPEIRTGERQKRFSLALARKHAADGVVIRRGG